MWTARLCSELSAFRCIRRRFGEKEFYTDTAREGGWEFKSWPIGHHRGRHDRLAHLRAFRRRSWRWRGGRSENAYSADPLLAPAGVGCFCYSAMAAVHCSRLSKVLGSTIMPPYGPAITRFQINATVEAMRISSSDKILAQRT